MADQGPRRGEGPHGVRAWTAVLRLALAPIGLALLLVAGSPAAAASAVSCGGAAMLGGAQLMCSHVDPKQPAQLCTFSWDLMTTDNTSKVVEGSFLLQPGSSNVQVYQANGFNSQLSQPIVLCQGKKGKN